MSTLISGAQNIEKKVSDLLNSRIASFKHEVVGREPEVLLVDLGFLNYGLGGRLIARKNGFVSFIDSNRYRAVIGLRAILDVLLEGGYDCIEHMDAQEFSRVSNIILGYIDIGGLALQLRTQRMYPAKEAVFKGGMIGDTYDRAMYAAIDPWVKSAGADPSWTNWYLTRHEKHRKEAGMLIQQEFWKLHGLRETDLEWIDQYFEGVCKGHMERISTISPATPDGLPFVRLDRKKLLRIFSDHMSGKEARKWAKLLEYRPGLDLFRHPLIRLRLRGNWVYTLLTWVFTPSNFFWGAWIEGMLLDHLDLASRGKWAKGYGDVFELYVDHVIRETGLPVKNYGKRKIEASVCPEISAWLVKLGKSEKFEIDRFIQAGDILFVVSCKARDFLYDRKISRRDLFFPIPEIEARIEQNIKDMNEIQAEAECIASLPSVRKRLGLGGSVLVPVVLTSRLEPMGVIDIRNYYSSKLQFPPVPMLKAGDFVEMLKEPGKWIANGSLPHV